MSTPTFAAHDATTYSAPEPTFTAQSEVPHQWYMTTYIPETTLSTGTCFGPPDTGFYMATRVNSFMSTGGDMNFQVTGITNLDLVGEFLVNVTASTTMTTPSTIDVNAAQAITIVSGIGEPAVLFPNHPGNEGGDPSLGGDDGVAGNDQTGRAVNEAPHVPENWGIAHTAIPEPVSESALAIRLAARIAAGSVALYHLFEAPLTGKFAAAGVFAGAAVGAGIGIAAFAKSSAAVPVIADASASAATLPPGGTHAGTRADKTNPDIDLTAYANILGKAKTGIGWYTPASIKSTADTCIQNNSPVIQNNAGVIIANSAGDFIWNNAGMEIKNEALSLVNSATAIASTAYVVNSSAAGVAASMLGGIAASVTGGIGTSVSGLAFCELTSFGITQVEAGLMVNIIAGMMTTINTPSLVKLTPMQREVGVAKTGLWADVRNIAASIKENAATYMVNSAMQSFKGAKIAIG